MHVNYAKPFDYFIQNNDQVVDYLEGKIKALEWQKFSCTDLELQKIEDAIESIKKTIAFNRKLL